MSPSENLVEFPPRPVWHLDQLLEWRLSVALVFLPSAGLVGSLSNRPPERWIGMQHWKTWPSLTVRVLLKKSRRILF